VKETKSTELSRHHPEHFVTNC